MNYIQYGSSFFHGNSAKYGTDGLLMNGRAEQTIALFGNELAADSLTFVVNSRYLTSPSGGYAFLLDRNNRPLKSSDGKWLLVRAVYPDWRTFTPGAPLDLYNQQGGRVIGRFYVQNVRQISRKFVEFTCTDCVGILDAMPDHLGGIYQGATIGSIIAEIFNGSGLSFSVSSEVAAVQAYGRLPRDNRRTNLGRVLIATGATLTEDGATVVISYVGSGTSTNIPQSVIYLNTGSVNYKSPATQVQVTEHAFFRTSNDLTETLFDNSAEVVPDAGNQTVIFDEPCYDLQTTGTLVIVQSNENFAIVNGVGTLTGKVYTHTRKVITKSTGAAAATRVESIDDNELIGLHNSDYVAQRMANFYKLTRGVSMEVYDNTGAIMPGTKLTLVDPFGVSRVGWLERKSFELGNKTRAQMDIAIDWQPGPWGSNVDVYTLLTESQSWTVPEGVTSIKIILGGGGSGGQGGGNGGDGEDGAKGEGVKPGTGGDAGAGGSAGKVYSTTVAVTPGQVVTLTIGTGGAGGAAGGGNGSAGTATTVRIGSTTYTSASGSVPAAGFIDQFHGAVYALPGEAGTKGGDGGAYSGSQYVAKGVEWLGLTWTGGEPGETSVKRGYGSNRAYGVGGGGSGAAVGTWGAPSVASNGKPGGAGRTEMSDGRNSANATGGKGADGPDAKTLWFELPTFSSGGNGGNGGGGGGAGGPAEGAWRGSGASSYWGNNNPGRGGKGGSGSAGMKGADGFALFLYKQVQSA